MSLRRKISPFFARTLTHPRTRALRRRLAETRRRIAKEPHRVFYFHQVDDPYSALAAQVLRPLLRRYDVLLEAELVGPPPDAAAPEREKLVAYARKDAGDVAPGYGLVFEDRGAPSPENVMLATRILAGISSSVDFASLAAQVSQALFAHDRGALERIAARHIPVDEARAQASVRRGSKLRARKGHYLGAMFYYQGEWHWGVDRLHHLERQLDERGRSRGRERKARSDFIAPRPDYDRDGKPFPSDERLQLEYYPSLRSPYSAIAMRRTFALAERLPVDLVLRPVLPMVMRGLPVPAVKSRYILLDTKREADDAGEDFGNTCDPVGKPVEGAFALFPWAHAQGLGAPYLASFTRAAFAEGIDTGQESGLRLVAERAGLDWDEAQEQRTGEAWREILEANRAAMAGAGLWGVPSYRLLGRAGEPDFATWGQDRIWRVEEEVRRRLGGPLLIPASETA